MRFESRELKDSAEPVRPEDFKVGLVYFAVQFLDEDLLVPIVQPLIFVRRDSDRFVFQDYDAYLAGVRLESASDDERQFFQVPGKEGMNHIFEYERALEVLMLCALKRRER